MLLPIFAEDPVGPVGWGALVVAGGSVVVNVVLAILNTRHKNKMEAMKESTQSRMQIEESAIGQYQKLVAMLQDNARHYEVKVDNLIKEMGEARVREQSCQDQLNENWEVLLMLYEEYHTIHSGATSGGLTVGALRPKPVRRFFGKANTYAQAQQEHEARLLKRETDDTMRQPGKGLQDGPSGGGRP